MDLRLGTFNVWGLPKPFADDVSARTRAIVERLPGIDLDILLIQEAWSDEVRDTLRLAAQRAGLHVALASREHGGGLMVISRLPILYNRFEKFQFRGDPERPTLGEFFGAKGYQALVLEGPNAPFHLINTHLHARYRRFRPALNSAVRVSQLLQLVGELHRMKGPVIIGGDFNCVDFDPEYRVFTGLTGCIEAAQDRRDLPTIARANYYKRARTAPDKRVDYLFHRPAPGASVEFADAGLLFAEREVIHGTPRHLSDHYGIRAHLSWDAGVANVSAKMGSHHDPEAIRLARELLDVGHVEADRRERTHFRYAGAWAAASAVTASLYQDPAMDRRRFLRCTLGGLAIACLGPAAGFAALARVDSDQKRDAFDDARAVLAQIEAQLQSTV